MFIHSSWQMESGPILVLFLPLSINSGPAHCAISDPSWLVSSHLVISSEAEAGWLTRIARGFTHIPISYTQLRSSQSITQKPSSRRSNHEGLRPPRIRGDWTIGAKGFSHLSPSGPDHDAIMLRRCAYADCRLAEHRIRL
ncbi:hypothetical protein V8C40DRAFT_257619 [Trichoderma camerunense]